MVDCNAYFCLNITPSKTSLILIPEQGHGEKLKFKEIDEYLTDRGIEYEKVDLANAITNLMETKEIFLSNKNRLPEDESVNIVVTPDRYQVIGRFYPPSNLGKKMMKEDIIAAMVKKGVKFGVNDKIIQGFLENREYCKDYVLGSALLPVEGKDAEIIYYVNIDLNKKPKVNEDGSVDFHRLDNINHVSKDELLAEFFPADKGKPGIDVCGTGLKPRNVKVENLKIGKNVYTNEDRTKIFSSVNGHVTMINGALHVSDTYEVLKDVDASTGDIVYEGNVTVKGNVRTGYKITAKGDIIIEGVVEGAVLEAKGQIILKRGIQGMNKGILKAGGSIVSKFIESASVTAGGFITTEAIMHSYVSAQGDITVNGRRSFITGGEIRSTSMIHAKLAGSTMGTPTVLEVGVDPALVEEYRRMEREIPLMQAEIEKSKQLFAVFAKKLKNGEKLPVDKLIYIKTTQEANQRLEHTINEYRLRMEQLQKEMENNENGCIKIIETIYPGCKLVISGVVQFIRTESKHCRFIKDKADIKLLAY